MGDVIDFKQVSTAGLESSPVAEALAGLRANEARYYKTKYGHDFTVVPASDAPEILDRVTAILADERDITIASPALEVSDFEVGPDDGRLHMSYVFYESGPRGERHVQHRSRWEACRRVQALGRHGRPGRVGVEVQVRASEIETRRRDPRVVLRHQRGGLTPGVTRSGYSVWRDRRSCGRPTWPPRSRRPSGSPDRAT